MTIKKIVSLVLIILGFAGLIYGVFALFTGGLKQSYPWAALILGLIFFPAGMKLLKNMDS